jgi:hypothetical protein
MTKVHKWVKTKVRKWKTKPQGKHQSTQRRTLKKHKWLARKAPQTPAPADQKAALSMSKSVRLQIKKIVILPNRRKRDEDAVLTIAESMRKLRQLEPIRVRKTRVGLATKIVLVDGLHRIEAAKVLGWPDIAAV